MNRMLGVAFTVHAMAHERAHHLHPDSTCAEIILASDDHADSQVVTGWCETLCVDCAVARDEAAAHQGALRLARALERWRHGGVTDVVVHCEDGARRAVPIVTAIAAAGFGRSHFWERTRSTTVDGFCNAMLRELKTLLRESEPTVH